MRTKWPWTFTEIISRDFHAIICKHAAGQRILHDMEFTASFTDLRADGIQSISFLTPVYSTRITASLRLIQSAYWAQHFFLTFFRNCQRVFTSFQLKSLCHLHRQRLLVPNGNLKQWSAEICY